MNSGIVQRGVTIIGIGEKPFVAQGKVSEC